MVCEAVLLKNYYFSKSDELLIDTNVWFYIYGPLNPKDWRSRDYSQALKWIIQAKSTIFYDVLILSEFVNRYSRLEFNLWKESSQINDYKEYRKHDDFDLVASAIAAALRKIVGQAKPIESGVQSIDIQQFIQCYERLHPDFNDIVLLELCRRKGLKLITHDSDFKNCDVPVITANRHILAQ